MIRAALAALTWLDKRFPPRVTVTQETFDALLEREHQRAKQASSHRLDLDTTKERVRVLETAVAALKDALAKGGTGAIVAETRRAAFVATGRMPE